MRPFPFLMTATICVGVKRLATPTNEGIAGGEPVIFSPWQTPHWLR